ncbi:MAG: trehalose-phosphatase [Candidatus Eisenbacteria bacterium]|nr:trehalose-phosphatase [Candidatus Eisenbacteria bacterium]
MRVLNDRTDPDEFFGRLAAAARSVLLLDYDGTLAPFRVERELAVPYPGVRDLLRDLLRLKRCRVVLVTGRWSEHVLPLLGLERPPEIWASHGWERRFPDGRVELAPLEEPTVMGLAQADDWAIAERLQDRIERKPAGLALHWRGLPPDRVEDLRARAVEAWTRFAAGNELLIAEFDGGVELRAGGRTKGFAVDTVISEVEDDVPSAYLGDDWTDEDAFRALEGRGLRVLVREELRPTAADLWIRPPGELLEFLGRWIDAMGDRK